MNQTKPWIELSKSRDRDMRYELEVWVIKNENWILSYLQQQQQQKEEKWELISSDQTGSQIPQAVFNGFLTGQ